MKQRFHLPLGGGCSESFDSEVCIPTLQVAGQNANCSEPLHFEAQPHKRRRVDKNPEQEGCGFSRLFPAGLSGGIRALGHSRDSTPHSCHLAAVAMGSRYGLVNIPSLCECVASVQFFGEPRCPAFESWVSTFSSSHLG